MSCLWQPHHSPWLWKMLLWIENRSTGTILIMNCIPCWDSHGIPGSAGIAGMVMIQGGLFASATGGQAVSYDCLYSQIPTLQMYSYVITITIDELPISLASQIACSLVCELLDFLLA
jgi:hypothetical protein